MTNTESTRYYPFNAVNDFMRDDYRLLVLTEVLTNMEKVSPEHKMRIGRLISKGIQVQGFRNSNLAPAGLKAKKSADLFERSPEFAALIMETWSRLHPELREVTGRLLVERNWAIQADNIDMSGEPGFKGDWPKDDTFQILIDKARELLPAMNESDDDISLMAVWVGNRLPYALYESENN